MNAAERREARRKRILENTESRLKKIITLTVEENVPNGLAELEQDKRGNDLCIWLFIDSFNFLCLFLSLTN